MNTPTDHLPAVEAFQSPTGIAGFRALCQCGLDIRNTVRSNAEQEVRDHAAYMAAKGR